MWTSTDYELLSHYDIVLGSSSPRRQDILAHNIGLPQFRILKSTFDEDLPKSGSDIDYVTQTAHLKAHSILPLLENPSILLVADTVVSCGGQIYEKPENDSHQMQMLSNYRSNAVSVITAVHVFRVMGGKVEKHVSECETTELTFDTALTDDSLLQYIRSGEGNDAAGGFKYQGLGSMLFREIHGDFFNVVGLPVKLTQDLVSQVINGTTEDN